MTIPPRPPAAGAGQGIFDRRPDQNRFNEMTVRKARQARIARPTPPRLPNAPTLQTRRNGQMRPTRSSGQMRQTHSNDQITQQRQARIDPELRQRMKRARMRIHAFHDSACDREIAACKISRARRGRIIREQQMRRGRIAQDSYRKTGRAHAAIICLIACRRECSREAISPHQDNSRALANR